MPKNTNDSSTKKSNTKNSINKDKKEEVVKNSTAKSTKTTKNSSSKKTTSTSAKKTPTKKVTQKKSSPKVATSKTTKKVATKKSTATKSSKSKKVSASKKAEVIEYYDLPYRYNQTVVRILAQTPNTLFVYWDIADSDRQRYVDQFGEDFFQSTVPVLIVHNKTMNYSFEIEINDFANSWYFNINDPKCDYEIELGRRAKPNTINLPDDYMYVTSSNVIETPNNHILFEKNQKVLFFRNVKDNTRFEKNSSSFNFMQYAGKIYNIYDIYKKIYKAEELQNLQNNPSSSFNKGEF